MTFDRRAHDFFAVDADISVMGLRFCEFIFQVKFVEK